jgi:hypothetical protein
MGRIWMGVIPVNTCILLGKLAGGALIHEQGTKRGSDEQADEEVFHG